MFIGKHGKPLFVDGILEGLLLRPHDQLDDVVRRAARRSHDASNVFKHQLALPFNVVGELSCFRFHSKDATRHHDVADDAAHWDGVLVPEAGYFETATFAHRFLLANRMDTQAAPAAKKDTVWEKMLKLEESEISGCKLQNLKLDPLTRR